MRKSSRPAATNAAIRRSVCSRSSIGCRAGSRETTAGRTRDPRGTASGRSQRTDRRGEGCCDGGSRRARASPARDRGSRAARARAERAHSLRAPPDRASSDTSGTTGRNGEPAGRQSRAATSTAIAVASSSGTPREIVARQRALLEKRAPRPAEKPNRPVTVPQLERVALVQRLVVPLPRHFDHDVAGRSDIGVVRERERLLELEPPLSSGSPRNRLRDTQIGTGAFHVASLTDERTRRPRLAP